MLDRHLVFRSLDMLTGREADDCARIRMVERVCSSMFLKGCSNVCYRNSFCCLGAQKYLVLRATIVIEML